MTTPEEVQSKLYNATPLQKKLAIKLLQKLLRKQTKEEDRINIQKAIAMIKQYIVYL